MANDDKVVRVTLNGSGLPVPNQDPITAKKNSQKVKWCADFPFTISIEGYSDVVCDHPTGSDCEYRCKTGFFSDAGTYKYSITANGKTNDPTLIIEP